MFNKDHGRISGTSFIGNRASNVGGAMKLFNLYSDLNPEEGMIFEDNEDFKKQSPYSEGKPSYYIFSFYRVIVVKTFTELDNLEKWTQNSTRTVLSMLLFTLKSYFFVL